MGARTHPAPHLLSRYGPGHGSLYVEFVRNGWTNTHEEMLGGVRRQMLHAAVLDFGGVGGGRYSAPLPDDFLAACESRLGLGADEIARLTTEHISCAFVTKEST